MPPPATSRRATSADVDAILGHVQAGFNSYVGFAPAGWVPPGAADMREQTAELLDDPDTWALLALVDERSVGHVSFFSGRERTGEPRGDRDRHSIPLIPGLAHLWQLFVVPQWWGRGVAAMLYGAAIAEMRARGYQCGRLFTPSAHVRARRFYERRGWSVADEGWNDRLQLLLCEYRLALSAS